jgi:Putative Flp pilus-assembly TadE/G-like
MNLSRSMGRKGQLIRRKFYRDSKGEGCRDPKRAIRMAIQMQCPELSTGRHVRSQSTCGQLPARRGNVLVIFAFIVFAAMAMAALVVDLGFGRLTQLQMQTAADSSALEGLRLRDDLPAAWRPNGVTPPVLPQGLTSQCGPQPATPYDPTNVQWQQWIDCARRYSASQLTSVTFDDDLNPADGDQQQFGAGPVAEVTDTIGNPALEAGGIISTPSPPVYKPLLQANLGNTAQGDLVSGTYGWNLAYDDATASMDESADYSRRDFVPDLAPGTITDTGFLARLRRSPENFGSATGVASNGPPIPFLFGRGSMIPRIPGENGNLSVQSGITIRATAIAAAGTVSLNPTGSTTPTTVVGHVLTVGPVDTVDGIRGLAPFGVTLTYWQSLNNPANGAQGADSPTVNPTTGLLTSNLPPQPGTIPNPNAVEAGVTGANQALLTTIGQVFVAGASDAPLGVAPTLYTYVPIYSTIGTTARTIVGFGFVTWSYAPGQLSIKVPWNAPQNSPRDRIAVENASGSLLTPMPPQILQAGAAVVQQVFDTNQGLPASLLAPVLVNHFLGPNFQP